MTGADAPGGTRPMVELSGVMKEFRPRGQQPVSAVAGVDLQIDSGEVVAFLGANGAGKTTTLDMVLGLTEPTSGTVRVLGEPPRRAVTAGKVSAVLQTGGLLRDLSVRETVRMIASTFSEHAGVDAVIERAGLTGLVDRKVSKCSGGEQQRLRFALALLPDPQLLILDEPTAGMDVSARRQFWDTMHADAATGRTVVFATHYLEEADAFAQRIVMIAKGRIVADGTTEEIRSRAAGRVVTADLPQEGRDRALTALRELPGASVERGNRRRVSVHAVDSDAVARLLLTELGGTNLEVASGSLETAFMSFTGESEPDTATGPGEESA